MVDKSTQDEKKDTPAEEVVPSSESTESDVVDNAKDEEVLTETTEPQATSDEKSHDSDKEAQEETKDPKADVEEPVKKSRGRPKQSEGTEPVKKKPKKEIEKPSPTRASARVRNQKTGVKHENKEKLPERKRSLTKKVTKDKGQQNGEAVEAWADISQVAFVVQISKVFKKRKVECFFYSLLHKSHS